MSIYDSKAVTQINFDKNFAKFGREETKFMKKIWALRARNSGSGQPPGRGTAEAKPTAPRRGTAGTQTEYEDPP